MAVAGAMIESLTRLLPVSPCTHKHGPCFAYGGVVRLMREGRPGSEGGNSEGGDEEQSCPPSDSPSVDAFAHRTPGK